MSRPPEPSREPVRPVVALAFTAAAFVALVIAGLGVVSLATDQDVIATPGLGQLPGVLGIVLAAGALAVVVWIGVRARDSGFWNALWVAIECFLGYLLGVGIGVLVTGGDPAVAAGVAGRLATSWFGVIIAAAGLVASWSAIALVRTSARRPRWPWERDDEQ